MQNLWYGKKQIKSGKSSRITISFDVIRMWQIHYQGPVWATVIAVYLYAPWYLGSYSFTYFSIYFSREMQPFISNSWNFWCGENAEY